MIITAARVIVSAKAPRVLVVVVDAGEGEGMMVRGGRLGAAERE